MSETEFADVGPPVNVQPFCALAERKEIATTRRHHIVLVFIAVLP
jgi:hypothetical protein